MIRIAILEYGVANLHTLAAALRRAGADVVVTPQTDEAISADALVLPAAGTFAAAAERLGPSSATLRSALLAGLPCLAIGLGMQLLFEGSEDATASGLGVVPGVVRRLATSRVPHTGWNRVVCGPDRLLGGRDFTAWFHNTSIGQPRDAHAVAAWSEHEGQQFPAAVRAGQTLGVQFRPEKSGAPGLELVRAFAAQIR